MIATVQIRDMAEVGLHMLSRQNIAFVRQMVGVAAPNYPESMAKVIAPYFFLAAAFGQSVSKQRECQQQTDSVLAP